MLFYTVIFTVTESRASRFLILFVRKYSILQQDKNQSTKQTTDFSFVEMTEKSGFLACCHFKRSEEYLTSKETEISLRVNKKTVH